jgi:hypothetical protein
VGVPLSTLREWNLGFLVYALLRGFHEKNKNEVHFMVLLNFWLQIIYTLKKII